MKTMVASSAALTIAAALWLTTAPPAAAQVAVEPFRLSVPAMAIGLGVRDVTREDADRAKMAQPLGAYVESVREGSPAQEAGFAVGDIVIDFDGERVRSAGHLTRIVQESAARRTVSATVIRGAERRTLSVTPEASSLVRPILPPNFERDLERRLGQLRERLPRDFNFRVDPDALRRGGVIRSGDTPALGITIQPLSTQLAEYFGVKGGVLVSSVSNESPAAAAGVRAGDVITAVGGRAVETITDLQTAVRSSEPGSSVELAITRDRKPTTLKVTLPSARNTTSGRGGLPI